MENRAGRQNLGNKKKRWENTGADKSRDPYDPTKEKMIAEVGRISLDKHNRTQLIVELFSYEGTQPARVGVHKTGYSAENGAPYSSQSIGKLRPDYVTQLVALLIRGAEMATKGVAAKGSETGAFTVTP